MGKANSRVFQKWSKSGHYEDQHHDQNILNTLIFFPLKIPFIHAYVGMDKNKQARLTLFLQRETYNFHIV